MATNNILVPVEFVLLPQHKETWAYLIEEDKADMLTQMEWMRKCGRAHEGIQLANEYLTACRNRGFKGNFTKYYWKHASVVW